MPKAYRFTSRMPACVTVDAIGLVLDQRLKLAIARRPNRSKDRGMPDARVLADRGES
jgi:hypothetical protein